MYLSGELKCNIVLEIGQSTIYFLPRLLHNINMTQPQPLGKSEIFRDERSEYVIAFESYLNVIAIYEISWNQIKWFFVHYVVHCLSKCLWRRN